MRSYGWALIQGDSCKDFIPVGREARAQTTCRPRRDVTAQQGCLKERRLEKPDLLTS